MLQRQCTSVCLSVMEVHWRIIANLPCIAVAVHAGAREVIISGKSGGPLVCRLF